MKHLIIGSTGLLGQALMKECRARSYDVLGMARNGADWEIDLSEENDFHAVFDATMPTHVVNCAAVIDHDVCESDIEYAYRVNARAVSLMAEAASDMGLHFTQVSTDHFYTGGKFIKHTEAYPVTLVNEYARTKYAGECFASRHLVIRTNFTGLRGWKRPTFFEWAVNTLRSGEAMKVFTDYYTSTCDAGTVAKAILDLRTHNGVFNVASSEVSSKATFIHAIADALGIAFSAEVGSVRSLRSLRAESCGLDVSKAEEALKRKLPGLETVVRNLVDGLL